jgi:hypothetical protein
MLAQRPRLASGRVTTEARALSAAHWLLACEAALLIGTDTPQLRHVTGRLGAAGAAAAALAGTGEEVEEVKEEASPEEAPPPASVDEEEADALAAGRNHASSKCSRITCDPASSARVKTGEEAHAVHCSGAKPDASHGTPAAD